MKIFKDYQRIQPIRCKICDRVDCWQPIIRNTITIGFICEGFNSPEHDPIYGPKCYVQPVDFIRSNLVLAYQKVEPVELPIIEELNGFEETFEHHMKG